ncbi:MAG: rRNA pseudouridine synthase [Veillonellaceae bacterium]|nr:rRNA pseudouridine synthase [Veillonellaceae bacterium]
MKERLQKLISRAGLASRRQAEEWITAGRVTVNGKAVTELGTKADPERDTIRVDGKPLPQEAAVYYALFKPKGVLSTLRDPEGRTTVVDYLRGIKERVYPVGRLDYNTEGLLLLTNDGKLANLLAHPSSEIEKEYEVKIKGQIPPSMLETFRNGVPLEDGVTAPAQAAAQFDVRTGITTVQLVIHEGRNRQVRRMCEHFGYRVHSLKRVRYAFLTLQGLKRGSYRKLTEAEVQQLYAQATN